MFSSTLHTHLHLPEKEILHSTAALECAEAFATTHGLTSHVAAGPAVEEQPVPLIGGELEGQRPRMPHLPSGQDLN